MDVYSTVPKDFLKNLEFRAKVGRRAEKDAGFRRAQMVACKHDPLYFFNAWCWLYEPRPKIVNGKKQPHVIPFITWPHQDPFILEIEKHLGLDDMGAVKSRGEGGSWIAIYFAVRDWLFRDMSAIGLVSRNEEAVDSPDDPDSLFWKLLWSIKRLPEWMRGKDGVDWKRNVAEHTLKNNRNGSTISGYAATGDVASGGRKSWFLMDELAKFPRGPDREAMASTQHVTNSRLVVSTPKGREGAFYDLMHTDSAMIQLKLHWIDNPTRNRGLYELKNGAPVARDENNPLPANYSPPDKNVRERFQRLKNNGFTLEGKLRSPWYDHECDRAGATPQTIAQELDMDFGGSVHRYFTQDFFAKADATVRAPLKTGRITFDTDELTPEFSAVSDGPISLWSPLDVKNRPPQRPYIMGVDPSYGHGGIYTNNAAFSVIDGSTAEQVAEFAANNIPPEPFADLCIAVCKFFHDAYLVFELNGPGYGFAKQLMLRQYANVFKPKDDVKQAAKRSYKIGWHSSPDKKRMVLGQFSQKVKNGENVLRSQTLVKECWQYVIINGEIQNAAAHAATEDISKKQSHADRVIAAALAYWGLQDRPVVSAKVENESLTNPPPGTLAWREKLFADEAAKAKEDWDSRTCDDLAGGDTWWKASA